VTSNDRPSRAPRRDARNNIDRIVAAATSMFSEGGSGVPFEAIARQAGVGSATLHRHFPSRQSLFEAVYIEQVDMLCADLESLGSIDDSEEALMTWLLRFVNFILGKRAFTEEMAHDSPTVASCRARIYAAADPLLHRAQMEGRVRKDVVADDVLRMLTSIALGTYPVDRQLDKVVAVALSGLLLRPVALNITAVGDDVHMRVRSIG
jgi:AcrR family transcriptional regulator